MCNLRTFRLSVSSSVLHEPTRKVYICIKKKSSIVKHGCARDAYNIFWIRYDGTERPLIRCTWNIVGMARRIRTL